MFFASWLVKNPKRPIVGRMATTSAQRDATGDGIRPAPLPALHGSDQPLVELLRGDVALGVADLAVGLGVTATAVRQRLSRLMEAGVVVREPIASGRADGRGRPSHAYRLSEEGRRLGGDNFRDLAMVLWQEVRSIESPVVRKGLLGRIGRSLADACRSRAAGLGAGRSPGDCLASVAIALRDQQIACDCTAAESGDHVAVLTTHTCPYPQLAEADRGICAAERVMLEELVEAPVRLTECRLDGDTCCRFAVAAPPAEPRVQRSKRRKGA